MAASTEKHSPFAHARQGPPPSVSSARNSVVSNRNPPKARAALLAAMQRQPADARVQLHTANVQALQERRCRRRVAVLPMYTSVTVRILSQREAPMDAHVLDISETGMAIEMDYLPPLGQAVSVEFRVSGLGRVRNDQWTELAAAAQVVRHDNLDDFPCGPYKVGLRFVRISTMTQAQIARFIATQPG